MRLFRDSDPGLGVTLPGRKAPPLQLTLEVLAESSDLPLKVKTACNISLRTTSREPNVTA